MISLPPWNQTHFEQYVAIALDTMAHKGVVTADAASQPSLRPSAAWTKEGSLRIELTADLSAMGLPAVVPLSATTQPDGSVAWNLGHAAIRTIPAEWTPEEAGEGPSANLLRAAYQCSLEHGRAAGRGR